MPCALNRVSWMWSIARRSSTLQRLDMSESFTDTPLLTERFDQALHYATRHHSRQLRKGTPISYAVFCLKKKKKKKKCGIVTRTMLRLAEAILIAEDMNVID